MLFDLWFDVPHRPTHDADFLGFGSAEIPHVEAIFREICRIEVEDGIGFDPDSVKAAEIRKEANYAGVRVTLMGLLNSRMKDFFDLWILAKYSNFDGGVLSRAVAATFERRRTPFPSGVPIGLSDEFVTDTQKDRQWQAFLRKNAIDPMPLATVVADLRTFLLPVLESASANAGHDLAWRVGNGWR